MRLTKRIKSVFKSAPKTNHDEFWANHTPPFGSRCVCVKRHSTSQGYRQKPGHCDQADCHASEAIGGRS